jgi:hypothetical protein
MLRSALFRLAAVLAAAAAAPVASAQILPLTVPRGKLRWDFYGRFEEYDWRWRDGVREEAAGDFDRRSLDRTFLPGLAETEDRLRRITGLANLNLTLGSTRASKMVNLGTLGIGGAIGVTRRITVFGMIPIVRVKVEPRFLIDTLTATAGLSPNNGVLAGQLTAVVTDLNQRLNVDHAYDADPPLKSLAESTLNKLLDLQLLLNTPAVASFAPKAGTNLGTAYLAAVEAIQQDLSGPLGTTSFTGLPALPAGFIDRAVVDQYLTDENGTIQARPLDDVPETFYIGDVEVGAAFSLFDRFPKDAYAVGARSALQAIVRLRTARLAAPSRLFEIGTGDRQPDIEVNWVTDVVKGRLGARLLAGYNLQLPGNQNRRVTSPDQPIALATSLAGVRRDPGDVIRLGAAPFVRLAPYLSLYLGVDYWRKGTDVWSYVPGQPPIEGVDISVMGKDSKSDALLLSGGISYANSGLDKYGRRKLPMDASIRYERVAHTGIGIVPDSNVLRVDLRFYSHLFGSRP